MKQTDPLNGITLEQILIKLVEQLGWKRWVRRLISIVLIVTQALSRVLNF